MTAKLHVEWDQQLQRACDFGEHLAKELSRFEKVLHDWQKSIVSLRSVHEPFFDMGDSQMVAQEHEQYLSEDIQQDAQKELSELEADVPQVSSESSTSQGSMPAVSEAEVRPSGFQLPLEEKQRSSKMERLSNSLGKRIETELGDELSSKRSTTINPSGTDVLKATRSGTGSCTSSRTVTSLKQMRQVYSVADRDCEPELRSIWEEDREAMGRLPSAGRLFSNQEEPEHRHSQVGQIYVGNRGGLPLSCLNRIVIDPLSPTRVVLDILSMLFITYDIITVPLGIFDYEDSRVAKKCRLAALIYWSFDFIAGFFAGYHVRSGNIEVRFWMTAKKAWWTRAPLDFLILTIDWVLFIIDSTKAFASIARLSKMSRFLRVLRLVRLLRSSKLLELYKTMRTWPVSAAFLSFLSVARLIFNLTILNHFFGCSWYALGREGFNAQETWVSKYLNEDDSMLMRYLISYHWSISQFTPCAVPIQPTNLQERLYTITIVIFGLILYASLFGNVTAIINSSRKSAYEAMMADHNLKEFLMANKVPLNLSQRIQSFLRSHRIRKVRVLESDVPRLATLSSSLRQELHYRMYAPPLKQHPFLSLLSSKYFDTVVHLCHTATQMTTLLQNHEIFHYRRKCDSVWFPMSGVLEYKVGREKNDEGKRGPSYMCLKSGNKTSIDEGGWISEQPLWLNGWENRGRLTVIEQSDVVIIDCKIFVKTAGFHWSSSRFFHKYAKLFAAMMSLDAAENILIDDLWGTKYRFGRMSDALSSDKALKIRLEEHHDEHWSGLSSMRTSGSSVTVVGRSNEYVAGEKGSLLV